MPCPGTLVDYSLSSDNTTNLLESLKQHNPIHYLSDSEFAQIINYVDVTNEQIESFLVESPYFLAPSDAHHDSVRWLTVPQHSSYEFQLYEPMDILLKHILVSFGAYGPEKRYLHNKHSRVKDFHDDPIIWEEWTATKMKAVPFLSLIARNEEHFPRTAQRSEDFSYSTCVCPIEIKLDTTTGNQKTADADLAQCAYYAEQIMAAQPGRRAVYMPIITKTAVRLYCFDQAGVFIGPWVNIHQNPDKFIRIILFTLSSPATKIGLHPAFTYLGNELYISVQDVNYRVKEVLYHVPRGDGGPCRVWRADDPSGKECVIKWSWMAEEESVAPEYEILNTLKGLEGVVQIIGHETQQSMIKRRPFFADTKYKGDAVENLIVLTSYGGSLDNFTSPYELLCALRDGIAGHQNMWNAGVLHRDISYKNILLGPPGAKTGNRGVLIDMNRAISIAPTEYLPKANFEIGTPPFQSYNVVRSRLLKESNSPLPSHDYLDDLESFFWVFVWITMSFEAVMNKKPVPQPRNDILNALKSESGTTGVEIRKKILQNKIKVKLHPSYPAAFQTLMDRLRLFFQTNVLRRAKTSHPMRIEDMKGFADKHYRVVLGYFDEAIMVLEKDGAGGAMTGDVGTLKTDGGCEDSTGAEKVRADVDAGDVRGDTGENNPFLKQLPFTVPATLQARGFQPVFGVDPSTWNSSIQRLHTSPTQNAKASEPRVSQHTGDAEILLRPTEKAIPELAQAPAVSPLIAKPHVATGVAVKRKRGLEEKGDIDEELDHKEKRKRDDE
ncbi:hypothetical protein CVT24_001307 [Panaeolus cyanescens]|uniref:Protein kinase domain-containing protein n=1 Tax=Panaeolus cyanescens TaxID=181874 RepID=A0A409YYZ9_9AGAR|nr:hypothetical protein CVT24_001307 [Panaeolus cyanescens]